MLAQELEEKRGRFDINPVVGFHFGPGVVAKQMRLPAGYRSLGESHTHSHLSIFYGACRITNDGETKEYPQGFHIINIPAGVVHAFEAITDLDWACVNENPNDETDPSALDQLMVSGGSWHQSQKGG